MPSHASDRVVIAGGGVAGAAAACLLGPKALLIEREPAAHDKICGEFISAEAQHYLARLGLDLRALGAVPIHTVRLIHGSRAAATRLPFPAFSLSRRILDEALLRRAAALGAEVVRGHSVGALADGQLQVAGLGRLPAPALFLATGKHDWRGARRQPTSPPEDLVGLKMYFSLAPAQADELAGHVELLLFGGGYAGLQMVEGHAANLSLLIQRRRFEDAGRTWAGVQALLQQECPHLARRLSGAEPTLAKPLSAFRTPYGFIHEPGDASPDGVYRLGDQVAVIPSFTGDGISIALHSAFAAAACYGAGGSARYHQRLRRDLRPQIGRALALYRIARSAPALTVATAHAFPAALRWAARSTRLRHSDINIS